jgi:hypothetical protein
MFLYNRIIHEELKFNFLEYFFHLLINKVIFFDISFIYSNNKLTDNISNKKDVCVYYSTIEKVNKNFSKINYLVGFSDKSENLDLTVLSQKLKASFEKKENISQVVVSPIHNFVQLGIYFENLISNYIK